MSAWEIVLIGVGLAMDAFAASVVKGLRMTKVNWRHALVIALCFGGFQALMPLLGWMLGSQISGPIGAVDHWISFVLLLSIGGKMLYDAIWSSEMEMSEGLAMGELLMLAVATSIDALAVGIGFGLLRVQIGSAVGIIGGVTFVLALIGVAVGSRFGARYQRGAQIAGGVVLMLIGVRILIEHLR